MNRQLAEILVKKAFPAVPYSENDFINVKGDYSPFNGDITYWSKRESQAYDGITSKALIKQKHTCGHCGLKFADGEKIHLHHVNGKHNDWKANNLIAIHQSCHQYIHMSNKQKLRVSGAGYTEMGTSGSK